MGEVECYGVALCEPCRHLEQLTRPGIIEDLVHRAGINADILTDGRISIGDKIIAVHEREVCMTGPSHRRCWRPRPGATPSDLLNTASV